MSSHVDCQIAPINCLYSYLVGEGFSITGEVLPVRFSYRVLYVKTFLSVFLRGGNGQGQSKLSFCAAGDPLASQQHERVVGLEMRK